MRETQLWELGGLPWASSSLPILGAFGLKENFMGVELKIIF